MKDHLSILELFDFVSGKISDPATLASIMDHLGQCESCWEKAQHQKYFITDHENILSNIFRAGEPKELFTEAFDRESFEEIDFVRVAAEMEDSAEIISNQLNPLEEILKKSTLLFSAMKEKAGSVKQQLLEIINDISVFPAFQPVLIPVSITSRPSDVFILGASTGKEPTNQEDRQERKELILNNVISGYSLEPADFECEYTGTILFINYCKNDADRLLRKNAIIAGTTGDSLIFSSTKFGRSDNKVTAQFKLNYLKTEESENHVSNDFLYPVVSLIIPE